jgi:hypothetical protein
MLRIDPEEFTPRPGARQRILEAGVSRQRALAFPRVVSDAAKIIAGHPHVSQLAYCAKDHRRAKLKAETAGLILEMVRQPPRRHLGITQR